MSKFKSAQTFIKWAAGSIKDDPDARLVELSEQIKAYLLGESSGLDVGEVCHRLMSLAPHFDGKLFEGVNISSTMRCVARELRHATSVSA